MQIDPAFRAPDSNEPDATARQALRAVAWLRGVSSRTLNALADEGITHRLPAGSVVFNQAEIPAFAQFLLAGSIELLGVRDHAETLIELLQPVDMVIPAAVVAGQPYLMRARVYEEARLLLVRAEAFRQAMGSDHALCRAVLGCVATQFRRQVRITKNLKLRSAEERVGCFLVSLLTRDESARVIRLPLEKNLIASQLGMARETFSRTLSGMAKFGMRVEGEFLHIEDAALARARFVLDPLIDGVEPILPLPNKRG